MTTDEFVAAYATDAMCGTHAGYLLAIGHYLPVGVSSLDPRVLAVIERCKSIHRIDQPELPETEQFPGASSTRPLHRTPNFAPARRAVQ